MHPRSFGDVFLRFGESALVEAESANDREDLAVAEEPAGEAVGEAHLARAPAPPRLGRIRVHGVRHQRSEQSGVVQRALMVAQRQQRLVRRPPQRGQQMVPIIHAQIVAALKEHAGAGCLDVQAESPDEVVVQPARVGRVRGDVRRHRAATPLRSVRVHRARIQLRCTSLLRCRRRGRSFALHEDTREREQREMQIHCPTEHEEGERMVAEVSPRISPPAAASPSLASSTMFATHVTLTNAQHDERFNIQRGA